jgi:hypothetical protein
MRSALAVRGSFTRALTSPTTVTAGEALYVTRTSTSGWLPLPCRCAAISASTACGVRPAAWMCPADVTPTKPRGCVVARVVARDRGSTLPPPNNVAGGAFQILISSPSHEAIAVVAPPPSPSDSVNNRCWRWAPSRRARASLSSTTCTHAAEPPAARSTWRALGLLASSQSGNVAYPPRARAQISAPTKLARRPFRPIAVVNASAGFKPWGARQRNGEHSSGSRYSSKIAGALGIEAELAGRRQGSGSIRAASRCVAAINRSSLRACRGGLTWSWRRVYSPSARSVTTS